MLASLERAGADLYYRTAGDGPPVVFLHGFSGNHLSWWQQVPAFADDYACMAPDQRRFGLSVDAVDGPGVAAFVEDLVAILDHLGHETVVVVGHSMGGWPAASLATQRPDRVAAMVLSGSPGGLLSREQHDRLRESAAGTLPDVDPLGPAATFLAESITALNRDAPSSFEDVRPVLEAFPIDPDAIADAAVPVLLVAGVADPFMPEPALEALCDRLPGAAATTIDGAGHSANFERPDAFNRAVRSFLADRLGDGTD